MKHNTTITHTMSAALLLASASVWAQTSPASPGPNPAVSDPVNPFLGTKQSLDELKDLEQRLRAELAVEKLRGDMRQAQLNAELAEQRAELERTQLRMQLQRANAPAASSAPQVLKPVPVAAPVVNAPRVPVGRALPAAAPTAPPVPPAPPAPTPAPAQGQVSVGKQVLSARSTPLGALPRVSAEPVTEGSGNAKAAGARSRAAVVVPPIPSGLPEDMARALAMPGQAR